MKKLIFLMMGFGLMMVFSGSASAQGYPIGDGAPIVVDEGGTTPAEGMTLVYRTLLREDCVSSPQKFSPYTTKAGAAFGGTIQYGMSSPRRDSSYDTLNFVKDGKVLATAMVKWNYLATPRFLSETPIIKVDNPIEFRKSDNLIVRAYDGFRRYRIQVIRDGKTKPEIMTIYVGDDIKNSAFKDASLRADIQCPAEWGDNC